MRYCTLVIFLLACNTQEYTYVEKTVEYVGYCDNFDYYCNVVFTDGTHGTGSYRAAKGDKVKVRVVKEE